MLAGLSKEFHLLGGPSKFSLDKVDTNHDLQSKQAAFAQFIAEYGRSYASKETAEQRFKIFSQNYDKIMTHNADPSKTYEMGLNDFADMTVDELKQRYF